MGKKRICDIIGITDEGMPIVTANCHCRYFTEQEGGLIGARECYYCKFADFRKSSNITLRQSICRCRQNRMNVADNDKNEQKPQSYSLIEKFASNIKGGVITCTFNSETQSSKAVYINAGWTAITGYTLEELNSEKGGNPQALVYPEDKATVDSEYNEQVRMGNEYALIYRVIRKGGDTIWVIDRGIVSVLSNGDVQNQSIVTEVTEIKEQEERMRRLAQIDQLTDLYNKGTFTQQAQMVLMRQWDKLHAVMILDIDDFKKINDSMGHAYGDRVLESVADCLKGLFRNRDVLGRIGGDEFMVLMTDIPSDELILQKAGELCFAIRGIKIDEGEQLPVTISVGIAVSGHGKDYEKMFSEADAALYRAKSDGKNRALFFRDIAVE